MARQLPLTYILLIIVLHTDEKQCSVHGHGEHWDSRDCRVHGTVEMDPDTEIRVIRKGVLR